MNTLHKNIMRDVYTAYALHLATRPIVRYTLLALIALEVLAKLVFVAAVIANARAVGVSHLPAFGMTALLHTNVLTIVSLSMLLYLSVAIVRELLKVSVVPARRFA